MIARADMLKRVPATGTLADDGIADLFRRNDAESRFGGVAKFGKSGTPVLLEIADTPEKRAYGLMGRRSMPACCGMLFSGLDGGAFWMKGCYVPLDIVFVKDGRVTRLYEMEVDGGARRYPYSDETSAIELKSGFCRRHGVKVGTSCTIRTW